MADKSLPFFGPSIEFSSVPPIETNRILSYFNQFVSNTVQILNKFAAMSDTKLMDLDFRLQDVEATLSILEAKLASIPSQEASAIPPIPPSVPSIPESAAAPCENSPKPPPLPAVVLSSGADDHQTAATSSNPAIARFVKMLAVGVPLMAVEQKMRAEGYDPSLLSGHADGGGSRGDHWSSDEAAVESNSDED